MRRRFIHDKILKKLQYSPVLAIQGARQTGKSFFVREILSKELPHSRYVTFDQDSALEFARRDSESFLAKYEAQSPLIIDEAQKVPKIFDAVKYAVDKDRVPGRFILLGSTEFSKLNLIRESLTGRITKIRFHPLTLAEAHELEPSGSTRPFYLSDQPRLNRKKFLKHLEQGGMPRIFSIRSHEERMGALRDWIERTVQRDVHTFPKLKPDSDLCMRILRSVAQLDEPEAGKIAKTLRVDLRRINTHLNALENLFAVAKVPPYSLGSGKPIWYLPDVAMAAFLNAPVQRQLETLFLQEYLAKRSFDESAKSERELSWYRTNKGTRVSFVEETDKALSAIQIFAEPSPNKRNFYAIGAFGEKAKKQTEKKVSLFALSPGEYSPVPGVKMLTWEHLA